MEWVNATFSSTAGVSYFVYGEKIPIYSANIDPVQKEFMEAGVDYMQTFARMRISMPIYRLFPNKDYRYYKKLVQKLRKAGQFPTNQG